MYKPGAKTTIPDNNAGLAAAANASKDAANTRSNNNLLATLSKDAVMTLGILEGSQVAKTGILNDAAKSQNRNDMILTLAHENARLASKEEANRHKEAIKGLKNDARAMELEAREANSIDVESLLA